MSVMLPGLPPPAIAAEFANKFAALQRRIRPTKSSIVSCALQRLGEEHV